MYTIDSLKKELNSVKNLQKIVSTMKSISVVNIKKYEKVASNIFKYRKNIDLGIQALLSCDVNLINSNYYTSVIDEEKARDIVIIIGSNHGLCGRFNDRVVEFYIENSKNDKNPYIISIGERIDSLLRSKKISIDYAFLLSNSIDEIVNLVYDIFTYIDKFKKVKQLRKVVIYSTNYINNDNLGNLTKKKIIPLDKDYFRKLSKKEWPTNNIPYWRVDSEILMSNLLQQYVFSSIYLAIAASMASEQRNRLITLQGSEQNIKSYISETNLKYNQRRQSIITSDLIDIINGINVIKRKL